MKYILLKLKNIFLNRIIRYPQIKKPILYMTILAKNEEDIIEENLIFHKKMGVDGFIVTDNNSSDRTKEIFKKYYEKGWIKEFIIEKSQEYSQIEWVDRMIKIAKYKYKADWIINADADEFWFNEIKDLKKTIEQSKANIIKCNIYNVLPEDEECFYKNNKLINGISNDEILKYDLSKFSIYNKQLPKIIHRTKGYREILMGNHGVKMTLPSIELSKDIKIFHYSIRGRDHFKNKMINGGKNVEKNLKLGKNVANHWRYFYEGYKNGTIDFDIEYEKVIGKKYFELFEKKGIYIEKNNIKDILENIKLEEK